jgi:hypothetical protein
MRPSCASSKKTGRNERHASFPKAPLTIVEIFQGYPVPCRLPEFGREESVTLPRASGSEQRFAKVDRNGLR